MTEQKNSLHTPLTLSLGIAIGLFIGFYFLSQKKETGADKEIQKFEQLVRLIKNEYVDTVKTSAIVEEAIRQTLNKLDPHSSYIPAEELVAMNEELNGNFEGIGIEFNIFRDTLVVVTPLSGGPSERVGLRAGDKIVKVENKNVANVHLTNREVQKYLKGPAGTKVNLEVLRKKNTLKFTIVRNKIPQYSMDAAYMVTKDIGYIKINRFAQTTYSEMHQALIKLKGEGLKKLVLDLQGNSGGYLEEAIKIADEFLPKGKKIVFTKGQEEKYNEENFVTLAGDFETGELAVLVDEGSASAAEIVSGALQDNDRAAIVGRRSFGKGLVQRSFALKDGSEVRLTISRYYTPSGRSIQKPYSNNERYREDILQRLNHGELFHADSIKFNDSLKYKTAGGRTVYGGGGIMPDYFVPLDSAKNYRYFNELFASNALREFAFRYGEEHKDEWKEKGYKNYCDRFIIAQEMIRQVMAAGRKNGVKESPRDFENNKNNIAIYLKAEIARRIWGNESFYPIYNQSNDELQKALEVLGER